MAVLAMGVANPVQRIKLGMLLIGSIFAVGVGARDVALTLSETEPTRYEVKDFAASYAGEKWLDVRGRLAVEYAHARPSTHRVHVDQGLIYVYVPVVARDWTPAAPVEVVANFGPIAGDQPIDWAALTGRVEAVSGVLRRGATPDADELGPGLSFSDALVVINVGTEPVVPLLSGGFTLLMIVVALMSGVALRNEYVERRSLEG